MTTMTPARLAEIRQVIDAQLADHPIGSAPPLVLAARELLSTLDGGRVVCVHPNTEMVDDGYLPGVGRDIDRKCADCEAIVGSGYEPPK